MQARRLSPFAAFLAVLPALSACSVEAPPVAPTTVQLAIVAGADHGGRPYSTDLTQEVTHTPVWSGDADGTGSATITINLGQGELCWDTSVASIMLPATASHIHEAAPGVRGSIVVGLAAPGTSGTSTGCRAVAHDLLKRVLQTPDAFYVNVHTSDYPAGAVRGQLGK